MRELRAISFSERELTTALVEFCSRSRRSLPYGTVLDARLIEVPDIRADLPIQDDYGTVTLSSFGEAEIAAALLQYCMERKVRMPARGEKLLRVLGGMATLIIWLPEPRPVRKMVRPPIQDKERSTAGSG